MLNSNWKYVQIDECLGFCMISYGILYLFVILTESRDWNRIHVGMSLATSWPTQIKAYSEDRFPATSLWRPTLPWQLGWRKCRSPLGRRLTRWRGWGLPGTPKFSGGDWKCLEPWNFMTFPKKWECHNPNWRTHIFQRGSRYTTNQLFVHFISAYSLLSCHAFFIFLRFLISLVHFCPFQIFPARATATMIIPNLFWRALGIFNDI